MKRLVTTANLAHDGTLIDNYLPFLDSNISRDNAGRFDFEDLAQKVDIAVNAIVDNHDLASHCQIDVDIAFRFQHLTCVKHRFLGRDDDLDNLTGFRSISFRDKFLRVIRHIPHRKPA